MSSYFVYEKSFDGQWRPTCYHGGKPAKSVNGSDPERSTFWEVPVELLGSDGVSPNFGKLMEIYPV